MSKHTTRTTLRAQAMALAAAFAAIAAVAHAGATPGGDDPPPAAGTPATTPESRPAGTPLGLASRPSLATVVGRYLKSDLPETMVVVWADFDASGKVLSARLIRGSGNPSLDRAILYWARTMVVRTTEPGGGLLPVILGVEDNIRQTSPVLPPLGDEVVARAREAGMARVTGEFSFRDSAFGPWAPRLKRPTGNAAVDDALLAWVRSLPPESLAAGTPVYPFDESTDAADREHLVRMFNHLRGPAAD